MKEIIYPLGAEIDIREIKVGDATMSVLEIWGAEYQENDCLLIKPESKALMEKIAERERCLVSFIGVIKGDGKIILKDRNADPGEFSRRMSREPPRLEFPTDLFNSFHSLWKLKFEI